MSIPPIDPDKSLAGIAVDPQTLQRVVPESRRPDGSVRKQLKIRPGFTPQEDVRRFRSARQQQVEANTLPKGHIIGWAPPPSTPSANEPAKPISKSAKKNAKRKEKRAEKKQQGSEEGVPESWDDDEEEVQAQEDSGGAMAPKSATGKKEQSNADELAEKLEKLKVEGS